MANQTRTFDPEAADEFISFLEAEIDALRTQVIDTYFKDSGSLTRMPAFGTGGNSDRLRADYTAFFTSTWGNLQGVIASYTGFIDTLEAIKESYAAADTAGAAELEQQI
jgi:hypothetical protein